MLATPGIATLHLGDDTACRRLTRCELQRFVIERELQFAFGCYLN